LSRWRFNERHRFFLRFDWLAWPSAGLQKVLPFHVRLQQMRNARLPDMPDFEHAHVGDVGLRDLLGRAHELRRAPRMLDDAGTR
jgi:hypothetical protein